MLQEALEKAGVPTKLVVRSGNHAHRGMIRGILLDPANTDMADALRNASVHGRPGQMMKEIVQPALAMRVGP